MRKISTITNRVRNIFGMQKPETPTLDLDQRVGSYFNASEREKISDQHTKELREQNAREIYESLSKLVDYVASSPLAKVLEKYDPGIPRIELMRWYEPNQSFNTFDKYHRITIKNTDSSVTDGHYNPGQPKAFLESGVFYDDSLLLSVPLIDKILQSRGKEQCERLLELTPENFEKQLAFPNEPGYANAQIVLRNEG